jgi:Fe-S cluster assembly ATP-binding protein
MPPCGIEFPPPWEAAGERGSPLRKERRRLMNDSTYKLIVTLLVLVIVIGGGSITHSGSADDILPKILTDTLGSCPVMTRGGANA